MNKLLLSIAVLLLLPGCKHAWEKEVKVDITVARYEQKMYFANKEFDSITISGSTPKRFIGIRTGDTVKFNATYVVDSTCLEFEHPGERIDLSIDTIKAIRNDTVYNYLRHKDGMFHVGDSAFYATSYLTQDQKIEDSKISKEKSLYRTRIIITVSMLLTLIFIIVVIKREKNKKDKEIREIEDLKKLYESIKIPLIMGGERISSSQRQTRQLATGALLYSLPKEHILSFNIQNISPKMITAIEVRLVYFNAFGDVLSSVLLSSNCTLQPYDIEHIEKYIDRPSNVVSFDVVITRVRFLDGTIWTNEK